MKLKQFFKTTDPGQTFALGFRLGQILKGGEVICLFGELGAGKTVLAKGLGKGLGVQDEITSPTFTLIQEYLVEEKGLTFVHMDLYRLRHWEEAEVIGVSDFFREDTVCLLEWPEIITELLPADRLEIIIEGSGDLERAITFIPKGRGKEWFFEEL